MPYQNIDQFIRDSGKNVTKVYEFSGNTVDEPVIVPIALANEIMEWLEKESKNQQIYANPEAQPRNVQLGASLKIENNGQQQQYIKTFVAPQ